MSTNLQAKLEEAVEHFKEVDKALSQARENVQTLEKALEQARGRATVFDELIQEQNASNGNSEDAVETVSDADISVVKP